METMKVFKVSGPIRQMEILNDDACDCDKSGLFNSDSRS